ncbi:hypothetical protein DCAR_0933388 [Daucus carota subsp. sativus]|uniref:rRNA N-glycosylase n=1 Tax=Daucus carota subsp. sativus TaxID=79200 RepID=A0A175YE01_DAUCS|nr:hypothetical protein DCAR_0933388 [Daucus carota subsp. sativus]
MDNTRSPSTVVSPDTDKPHILDLNKADGEEYHKFIKSIIDEFKTQEESQKLRGKDKPRESETLKEINDHIKLCFDLETLVVEVIDDKPGEDSPAQTPFEDDILPRRKFFQVMLTNNHRDLQILIQRSSMYLAGYKGKYRDDKAKIDDNVECWIILSGGCCDAAVKFVEEFLTPNKDFNQSLIPWETEIREAVKILSSLGYEIIIETKTGEKNKDMLKRKEKEKEKLKVEGKTEEELIEDLPEKIKFIKLLEKAIPQEDKSSGEMKKFLREDLEEECGQLLQKNGIFDELKLKTDDLDRGIINLYSEDLYEFYEELKKIATTLDKLMRYFRTGASYSVENEKIRDFEVNRQALIRAFKHLTQNPFKDDEEDFAKHITHLVVMICEATRFIPIAEHIEKCYTSTSNTKMSEKDVALINMWSDLSGIITRGWTYKGERDSGMVAFVNSVAVIKATNSLEE